MGITTLNCASSLSNQKLWLIYKVNEQTGDDEHQIQLDNNPTINYAELVIQPKSLPVYGLYRFVYTVTMINSDSISYSSQTSTYVSIIPSGIVISALKSIQGIFGGTVEISRGQNQAINFNPFTNTYDIDGLAVISSLSFKYSCQLIDSNNESGYPIMPESSSLIYLDDFLTNANLKTYDKCFNSTGSIIYYLNFY